MENASTINATVNKYQRGFHMAFANGYTVSIQFGSGNYCDVRDYSPNADDSKLPPAGCVEVGIFETESGKWVRLGEHDDVAGWAPVDVIPQILSFAQEANWDMVRYAINNPHEPTAEEMMDNIKEMLDEDAEIAKVAELDM